jgi:hypothetical protein
MCRYGRRISSEDAPTDAALGRHADLVGPLTRGVIHPARVHDAQQVADPVAWERALAGEGVDLQLAVDRCQADREAVTLRARLLGRVVAALTSTSATPGERYTVA